MTDDGNSLRGLYAVTPDGLTGAALFRAAEAACSGGARLLQYRNKSDDAAVRRADADALRAITAVCGTRFIINDDVELAQAVDADGVHVGRDDSDRLLPGNGWARARSSACRVTTISGARAPHGSPGADYVAFGAMFASATKPEAPPADIRRFAECAGLGVARCAIGGITLARAPALIAAGADLLAVVSDLFDAPDVHAQAQAYARLF
jgi:thiamine-phosphate pyrophosphorylase